MFSVFDTRQKVVVGGRKYYLIKQIGEGAFAYVYSAKAKHPVDGVVDVAIKKILCQSDEARHDAMKEIDVLMQVKHEYILPMYGSEIVNTTQGSEASIVMPLCELGTLQQYVTLGTYPHRSGLIHPSVRPEVQDAIPSVLLKAALGLEALHAAGFRHADLKPDNVLLHSNTSGTVIPYLTDFGSVAPIRTVLLSKRDRQSAQDYAASFSTASYRAPELWEPADQRYEPAEGLVIDGKSDVWAFGCLMYALLFASTPFESTTQGLSSLAVQSGTFKIPGC